jgi:peptidoglycan/xylan/chitin deacetylase (PgdA/CDA1 family)
VEPIPEEDSVTVPITGSVKDVTGVEDNDTPWSFASVIRFAEDGSVITEKPREVRAVSGNLKVNLVPGYAIVTYGKHVWQVTVPETPTTLKALIEAGVAFPPDTSQALLDAAVGQYVETHREQFRTRAIPVVSDPLMAQWVDEYDNPVGDPVPWSQVIDEAVAQAAAEAAAPAAVGQAAADMNPVPVPGPTPGKIAISFNGTTGDEFNPLPAAFGSISGDVETQPNIVAAQPRSRSRSAVACFTFDDCPVEDVTVVKPILDDKGVKGGFAFPSGFPGLTGLLTWAQIKEELYDEGHEILAHSVDHAHLDTFADPDMSLSATTAQINNKAVYASHGIAVRGFAYPFGEHNATLRKIVREHYDFALGTGSGGASGSQKPLRTYAIRRIALKDSTVTADHEAQIDTAIANGEIIVFIIHANPTAAEFTSAGGGHQRLADVIQYCLDNDVPVVTPSEAFGLTRNTLDAGDYVGGDRFAVIDAEGEPHLPPVAQGITMLGNAADALTKAPSAFNEGITLQPYMSSSGAPGSGPGTVQTVKVTSDNTVGGLNYQLYQRDSNNGLYIRAATTDLTGWTSWTAVGGGAGGVTILSPSSSAIGSPPSSYSEGVTLQLVTSPTSPASPRPDAGPGVLRTTIVVTGSSGGTANLQEFIGTNGIGRWVRSAASDNASWGSWISTTSVHTGSITSSATPTPYNSSGYDFQLSVNALATGATFAAPQAAIHIEGMQVTLRIKDNGTSQSLAFNSIYSFPSTKPAPTATVAGQVLYLVFRYSSNTSKYEYVSGHL